MQASHPDEEQKVELTEKDDENPNFNLDESESDTAIQRRMELQEKSRANVDSDSSMHTDGDSTKLLLDTQIQSTFAENQRK